MRHKRWPTTQERSVELAGGQAMDQQAWPSDAGEEPLAGES